ncbi:MAG: hypothetical protein WD827_06925 [Solirubrobacterales bacterium]
MKLASPHHLLPLAVLAVFAVVSTSAAPATIVEAPTEPPTVYIREVNGKLRFVAPKTIVTGEELRVLSETNPKEVGPHTFSLVKKFALPKTPKARKNCFTPKHICLAISKWHGVKPRTEQVTIDLAKAGTEGWSTLGSPSKRGDSWYTEELGSSISQLVAVDTSAGPRRIYFLDAVHPWMRGSINVLPPG